MRLLGPGELEALSADVGNKIRRLVTHVAASESDRGQHDLPALENWIEHRFKVPLEVSAEAGPDYSKAFTVLSILTIGAGLASSVIASTGHPSKLVIGILGLAVGLFTAVNQVWNPGQRAIARYQAAYALRREGWDFVHDRGRYIGLEQDGRLGAFIDEVNRIHRGVETIDESTSPAQPGS